MEYSFRLQLTTNGISIKSLIYIHELYACLLIVIPIIPFNEYAILCLHDFPECWLIDLKIINRVILF